MSVSSQSGFEAGRSRAVVHRAGFTLLELIVVVVIIGIISSAIVPVYVASMDGLRKRNAQLDLIAVLRHAQERAVSDSREYRFYMDPGKSGEPGSYWVAKLVDFDGEKKVFDALDEDFGQQHFLPARLEMENPRAKRDKEADAYYIGCYPNGACDIVTIKLRDTATGRTSISIKTMGVMGRFEIEDSRERGR